MKPMTSFEIHTAAIEQKLTDAKAFMKIGARDDAARLHREIATMKFGGATPREVATLLRRVDIAVAEIGALLDEVSAA